MNLQNNHPEMKTIVETFVIEETAPLIYDNEQLDKWNSLVSELGLEGQTKIQAKEKSPIPFMHLKQNFVKVFETLCPRKVDVKDYNVTPIPVEILDLISLSVNEKYFDKIQIWYDDKNPDPVCIGLKGEWYSYKKGGNLDKCFSSEKEAIEASIANEQEPKAYFIDWNAQKYILGKWADVKRSFAELVKMATDRFIAEKGNEYRKAIKENQRKLDDLEIEAFDTFGSSVNGIDESLPF